MVDDLRKPAFRHGIIMVAGYPSGGEVVRTPVRDTECDPAISYGALQGSGSVKVCTE